jgi:hypothetical protein
MEDIKDTFSRSLRIQAICRSNLGRGSSRGRGSAQSLWHQEFRPAGGITLRVAIFTLDLGKLRLLDVLSSDQEVL